MRILRWFGIAIAILLGLLLSVGIAARFSDGPLAIVAGGPLVGGELVSGSEPDWRFVRDIPTIEFQLLDPPRSRTTWILEHEGRIYIPCGYLDSPLGRIWKKWPIEAEKDGRAILRVDGKRYERQLVRVKDPATYDLLANQIQQKYHVEVAGASVDGDALWIFELAPRPEAS
jgi:hypothetical protein